MRGITVRDEAKITQSRSTVAPDHYSNLVFNNGTQRAITTYTSLQNFGILNRNARQSFTPMKMP